MTDDAVTDVPFTVPCTNTASPTVMRCCTTSHAEIGIAQARGSLLLLHMGIYVYCFDLAEKRFVPALMAGLPARSAIVCVAAP